MSFFKKEEPKPDPRDHDQSMDLEYDKRAIESLMKRGGKKMLDSVMNRLREYGPGLIRDLETSPDAAVVAEAARTLKSCSADLGLLGLEDVCDRILEKAAGDSWTADAGLAAELKHKWLNAFSWLDSMRLTL
jgi:hypothetical protein